MPAKKKAKVAPRPKRPRPRRSLTREDFVAAIEQRMAQIERLLYDVLTSLTSATTTIRRGK